MTKVQNHDKDALPTKRQFQAFEKVRISGRFNMYDPRARAATGLSSEVYSAVMKHYSELMEKYPDVRGKAG